LSLTAAQPPDELRHWVEQTSQRVDQQFSHRFWCERTGYPYDFVPDSGVPSGASELVRPNALIALAVAPHLFSRQQAHAVVRTVDEQLMTPVGIRTLSAQEVAYRGVNRGTLSDLDKSYHQGSVWPFLLGAYGTACRRLYGPDGPWRGALLEVIEATIANSTALGHVPELADGDFPHRPAGCFGFAPSVAELLRVLVEVLNV
jgi:glycogen debranching enzyme